MKNVKLKSGEIASYPRVALISSRAVRDPDNLKKTLVLGVQLQSLRGRLWYWIQLQSLKRLMENKVT